MNTLEGTYKHRHQPYSLKIERNYPELIDKFTFIQLDAEGNEITSFEKSLQGGTPGSLYLWAPGIEINHKTDFMQISISGLPSVELNGIYDRTD